jgi:protein-S-isoprenylcysteine O-methyltransferase Ste14
MASIESIVQYVGLLELLVFVIVLFGFMARLCRVPVKLTLQSKASQNFGALLFLMLCIAIVISTFGSVQSFGWTKFVPSLGLKITGVIIMLPSIIVMGWSQYHLGRQWTAAIQHSCLRVAGGALCRVTYITASK